MTRKSQVAASKTTEALDNAKVENKKVSIVDLLKTIENLQNEIVELKTGSKESKSEESREEFDDEYEDIEISPNAYIKVVSLIPYQLNLSTKPGGRGKIFSFPTFGSSKRIMYSDLVDILEVFQHFLENGYFYIQNRKVIRKHGLDDTYAKILDKEKIMQIVNSDPRADIIGLYKSCNKKQQEIIAQLLIDKRLQGEEIDLNMWDRFSRISGVNLQEKYDIAKEYLDSRSLLDKKNE